MDIKCHSQQSNSLRTDLLFATTSNDDEELISIVFPSTDSEQNNVNLLTQSQSFIRTHYS